jgi:hypothetical protein
MMVLANLSTVLDVPIRQFLAGLAILTLLVASLGTVVPRSSQTIVGRHTRTRPWCKLTRLRISSETSTPRASSEPARLLPQDTA